MLEAMAAEAEDGHEKVVEVLLRHPEIDLGKKDQSGDGGRTALDWARKKGNKRIIRMLKEKLAMNDDEEDVDISMDEDSSDSEDDYETDSDEDGRDFEETGLLRANYYDIGS